MTKRLAWSCAAGLCLAASYTVTPLTFCVLSAAAATLPILISELPVDERRRVTAILALALAARLIVVGAIFLRQVPYHHDQFVGATTGDEAYAMSRALRTRDILRHTQTTDRYDYFVAFDEYGRNSYVTALTAAQLVFGPAPYAIRLLNALLFTIGALLLFRVARDAFAPLPALVGLTMILFWPTLFFWSISLLKESLYFFLGATVLSGLVAGVRGTGWGRRILACTLAGIAAFLGRDLRPAALALTASGVALGFVAYFLSASIRRLTVAAVAAVVFGAVALAQPRVEAGVLERLDAAAKTHAGHVFTVGHDYKLLDDGFYLNPVTPAASSLALSRDQAARYLVRAAVSFFVVPAPWQLDSTRELAYLPEQLAWYVLVLLLPAGIIAGWRRDRLTTSLLIGIVLPTAAALSLTNGNVGTLLRLRGLVIPYLIWLSAAGFCAVVGTLGEGRRKINPIDAAVLVFVFALIPIAYGTYLLFRTPAVRLTSVTRAPIGREERRVAGGARLMGKLKVRGQNLRPMLRATIDSTPALGFVFEDPNTADVLVGDVAAGAHDLVLYDGVQEVARLARSVVIEATAAPRVAAVGTLLHLDKATVDSLKPGPLIAGSGLQDSIVALGPPKQEAGGLWMRPAEVLLQCDPDPNGEGCAVAGTPLYLRPLPTVKLVGPSGAVVLFALTEFFPDSKPVALTVTIRVAAPAEVLSQIHTGDRDNTLDERAAAVVAAGSRRKGAAMPEMDVTLQLGADDGADGWRYRDRILKAGAPVSLTTDRYAMEGVVLSVARDGRGSR